MAPLGRDQSGRLLTDAAMRAWIDTAVTGDRIEYYRGFLSVDIDPLLSRLAESDREEIARLAAFARRSAEVGHVHLVQEAPRRQPLLVRRCGLPVARATARARTRRAVTPRTGAPPLQLT
jgi:hypothetical protein